MRRRGARYGAATMCIGVGPGPGDGRRARVTRHARGCLTGRGDPRHRGRTTPTTSSTSTTVPRAGLGPSTSRSLAVSSGAPQPRSGPARDYQPLRRRQPTSLVAARQLLAGLLVTRASSSARPRSLYGDARARCWATPLRSSADDALTRRVASRWLLRRLSRAVRRRIQPRRYGRSCMSTSIDVVRRAYEAFKAGDAEALIAVADPEIEFGHLRRGAGRHLPRPPGHPALPEGDRGRLRRPLGCGDRARRRRRRRPRHPDRAHLRRGKGRRAASSCTSPTSGSCATGSSCAARSTSTPRRRSTRWKPTTG